MNDWKHLTSTDEMNSFIESNELAFLYISLPDCSVCHALMPQVKELLDHYPEIKLGHIDAAETEAVAGMFSIFTVPVLLLFVEGKEYLREARMVHLDLFEEKVDKIYHNWLH